MTKNEVLEEKRERERTQSRSDGQRAPGLHRPRAGGRLKDRQASSRKQGRVSPGGLLPHPRVSHAVTEHTCLRDN